MKLVLLLAFLFAFVDIALACEEKPLNSGVVYRCLLERHPSLQTLKLRGAENEARLKAAGQIPNPELEAKSLISGEKETEVELLQPIEIGGRRSARKALAQAEGALASMQDTAEVAEIALHAAEGLTRLRQLEHSLGLMFDAKASLTSILKRLQGKRVLTPEDRTVLGLLGLYESTLIQKFKIQQAERDSLRAAIEAASGSSLSNINWQRENRRQKWPSLSQAGASSSLAIKTAQAGLALAHAEIDQASGEAWPDLSIGPSFQRLNENQESSWGFKVSLTMPLWNLNGGNRTLAHVKAQQAEAGLGAALAFETSTLHSLRGLYEKAISALDAAPKPGSLNKLISQTERQFARGLIQPNALVEVYRSSLESLEVTNDTEMQALKAYFQHETALGRVPKELL